MNELAKKSLFINPDINYIFNTAIYEYDMKNAGISIAKSLNLLSKSEEKKIDKLRSMDKLSASIEMGNMMRNNKKLNEGISAGFIYFRNEFIERNKLKESDIISIKKDAFFLNKYVKETDMDKNVKFRIKNVYTSYIHLKPIELYYNQDTLDVKGIRDESCELHKNYFIKFLNRIFKLAENEDNEYILKELRKFYDKYKHFELEKEYYIPFTSDSRYIYKDGTKSYLCSDEDKYDLNITYNLGLITKLILIMI